MKGEIMEVAFLVIASTFIICFKQCVDNLSSRGKKSTSRNKDNINNSYSNTDSYTDILKHYKSLNEIFNKPKPPEFKFPTLYNFSEENPERNSFARLINPIDIHTNNLFRNAGNILNDMEIENLNREQSNSYRREETNKSKNKKTKYPRYFE